MKKKTYLKAVAILCIAVLTQFSILIASNPNKNEKVDYYAMYNSGESFNVGDITVNKTLYPSAIVIKPSEMKNTSFKAGGLIFVDNSSSKDLTFEGKAKAMPIEKDLVIIGQYKLAKQAEIIVNGSFYCKANAAFKNLKLTSGNNINIFTTAGTTMNPRLMVQDCDIIGSGTIIWDSNVSHCFSSISFDNSTIKLVTGKHLMTYSASKAVDAMLALTSVVFTNNVIYAKGMSQSHILNLGSRDSKVLTSNVNIMFKNNTIYDVFNPNVLIRATVAKGMEVVDNVGYFNASANKKNYFTTIFDKTMTSAIVTGNYLFTETSSQSNLWSARHTGGYPIKNNTLGETAKDPFTSKLDVKDAYFPINTEVVTNGAGANYENKYWIKK